MERKKSKHLISFPLHLDMNKFLRPQERSSKEQIYDLRGVLLHKGVSAYHGHYEAQVFDISYVVFHGSSALADLQSSPGLRVGINTMMRS
jgi:ubiquitin carboxyl-terminal hydrolase 48